MEASVTNLAYSRLLKSRSKSATKVRNDLGDDAGNRVDQEKLAHAASLILEAIGENVFREGLRDTPARFARMFQELCYGVGVDASTEITCSFDEGSDGLVVVRDIGFNSMCEHHLVPFIGTANIAYLPKNGVVTGLSKLARVVELTSRRPQVQERMTEEIARAIEDAIDPSGVAVLVEAEHFCMSMRGIKKPGSKTITTLFKGTMKTDMEARAEALSLLRDK
ncbi:MAG: GTP cyclohydrolase I FolE [Candidatus Obscuribacterales bacterium]|nr:GTP cyclohydrolase I FolE [Candidatus Obscuribacterales bacterium]